MRSMGSSDRLISHRNRLLKRLSRSFALGSGLLRRNQATRAGHLLLFPGITCHAQSPISIVDSAVLPLLCRGGWDNRCSMRYSMVRMLQFSHHMTYVRGLADEV